MENRILDDLYVSKYNRPVKPIVYVEDEDGCYICVSHAQNPNGYYKLKRDRKNIDMHVWLYRVYHGEIAGDLVVRHTCDNRECINPNHLTIGTRSENAMDMLNSDIEIRRLTEDEVLEIKRYLHNGTFKDYEIAEMFDIFPEQIYKIKNEVNWKHIKYKPD